MALNLRKCRAYRDPMAESLDVKADIVSLIPLEGTVTVESMNDASTLFVGPGKMREPIVRILADPSDLRLRRMTQTASRIAAAAGAQALTSLAQVPRSVDVVILMLPNSTIVESVLLGDDVSSGLLATLAPTRLAPGCWPREPRNAAPHRARPLLRRYERCHFHDTTKAAA
jgi:hypothetical protein